MKKIYMKRLICPAIIILLIFMLSWMFPLISDDWYREEVGRNCHNIQDLVVIVWSKWLGSNPRIIGNILAYISGGHPIIRWIMRGFFFSAVLLVSAKAAGFETSAGFLLMSSVVIALPRKMFCQIYPWGAGFFNYVPPVVIILTVLILLHPVFFGKKNVEKRCRAPIVFLLGFCGQLFIENDTIYAVCAALVLVIWYFVKKKHFSVSIAAYFAGTAMGALALFLSPAYRSFANKGESYSIEHGTSIIKIVRENARDICYDMIQNSPVIVLSLTLLLMIWLIRYKKKTGLADVLLAVAAAVLAAVLLLNHWQPFSLHLGADSPWIAILWYLLIGFALLRWIPRENVRNSALFYWLSALMAAAPLLVVRPIGSRCLYISYIFLLILCGILLKGLFADKKPSSWLIVPAAALMCLVFGFYFSKFIPIHAMEKERITAIEAAFDAGEDQVTIPAFPHSDFLWNSDISMGQFYYYKTPGDFVITVKDNHK